MSAKGSAPPELDKGDVAAEAETGLPDSDDAAVKEDKSSPEERPERDLEWTIGFWTVEAVCVDNATDGDVSKMCLRESVFPLAGMMGDAAWICRGGSGGFWSIMGVGTLAGTA